MQREIRTFGARLLYPPALLMLNVHVRLLPLLLVALCSCTEPFDLTVDETARWTLDWVAYYDVKCIAATTTEVASRTRFAGTSTLEVTRPHGDTRASVPIVETSAKVPTVQFTLAANCDADVHENAVVVNRPTADSEWHVRGEVLERDGTDSLRVTIGGRFTPTTVRLAMKDASRSTLEQQVLAPEQEYTFTIPFTIHALATTRYVNAPDGSFTAAYAFTLTYRGGRP